MEQLLAFTVITLLAAASLLCAQSTQDSAPAGRPSPHIVLFISDDHTWHDCGPYGAADVKTPNLDRLAQQSMKFTQAMATSPTCTPSRSSIYTGMYPFRNGAHANHSWINETVRTLPKYFHRLGYRVVLAGKTHIGPREQFPFEYLKGSNVMPAGKKHVLWTDLDTAVVDRLLAEHDRNTPLCLLVCSHSPHVFWPENHSYDPQRIDIPPYLLDTPETRIMRTKYYTDVTWMDTQLGEVMDSLTRYGYDDDSLLIYVSDQGAQWPFAKWTLYDAGIKVPLLMRWPGRIKAGSQSDALVTLADLLPTMLEAAGGKPPSAPAVIDGRSLLPVLRGDRHEHHEVVFASNTGDGQMNRSPMRALRTDRHKYILNLAPETVFKTHISDAGGEDGLFYWRSWQQLAETDAQARRHIERYRHHPPEELYDLRADPFEQHNLAADPAYAEVLAHLRQLMRDWRKQQGEDLDTVAMPEDARKGPLPYAD
jgi:N-sulfoglucosamine sulfohydrolase